MNKLYNDILELKTWIRKEEGAKAEGKGQFGKIHSEKQLMDLIYKYNEKKKKSINILWFNQNVEVVDNRVFANAKVVITNGEETIEENMTGLGEEKRSDISFGLGKALTYGKRFWLQKFLDLSSDDIDPEHISNKPTTKIVSNVPSTPNDGMAYYKNGKPVMSSDGVHITKEASRKGYEAGHKVWTMTIAEIEAL